MAKTSAALGFAIELKAGMRKLIIDTDVALGVWHEGRPRDIDDGFAMVEAFNSNRLDLLGVTCVYGNGPIEEVHRVASELVKLKKMEIPVHRGAEGSLEKMGDSTNPAVEFLAEQLQIQQLTIAAIGPLTNMALLVQHHPNCIANIEELVIVAGRSQGADFFIGEAGPVGDFNFENDVRAVELLMQAGIPMVLMGFELTSQVCVTKDDLDTIAEHATSTADYFYNNSLAWLKYWTDTFPQDHGFHPWDSAAVAWLENPGWFVHEQRGHSVQFTPKRLECDAAFSGPKHTYCTGFTPGGAQSFVDSVVTHVY
jgi:inosine-uridine nucleoside N-ribohydrolase